jgi:hypothetical protein
MVSAIASPTAGNLCEPAFGDEHIKRDRKGRQAGRGP